MNNKLGCSLSAFTKRSGIRCLIVKNIAAVTSHDSDVRKETKTMSDDEEQIGILQKEHDRWASMTNAEREQEHFEYACRSAAVREFELPDRQSHRQHWYSVRGLVVPEEES